ncbi:MAG: hypothetical protein Q4Q23_04185 [Methanobacteriaceae archaeon]|nr:hypothetical protein [Methanobacteriaceae archaeon]
MANKINNLLLAIFLYTLISYILQLPQLSLSILYASIGSQIIILIPEKYKNTLLIIVPMILLIDLYPMIIVPLIIGYLSTILMNLLGGEKCALFAPIRNTKFSGPRNYIETNTSKDYSTTIFLVVITITALIISTNSIVILENIHEDNNLGEYLTQDNNYYNNENQNTTIKHIVNINPSETHNKNITSTQINNTTTTIITDYVP